MDSFIIIGVFFAMGIVIGRGWRNEYAEKLEHKKFSEVDAEVRNRLAVAENLNKSLLSDVQYLRKKLHGQSTTHDNDNRSE